MYMIWLITVGNGQQKPIAIPAVRACFVEVIATTAATTLAVVAAPLPLMPTTAIPSVPYFM